ncbi:MAG: D-glycero-beta-D-manno-heptose 1-phosphate adenylyltransferase [Bacteroidales bacterium]|nr:D-glycero-beta-D-manno-heptose 1-phosphate adenylyltransferase [Bacteroidales bacterium]
MMNFIEHIQNKIVPPSFFKERADEIHKQKVVFTNGCFDILHLGHITYLAQARQLGDALVVGLNSDASVRRLKGPSRPVNDQNARAKVLAALECVDYVVFFEEDTPLNIITQVVPDVLVKGGDYSIDNIVGADFVMQNGGKVLTIPFVNGFSTTSIIENLKA